MKIAILIDNINHNNGVSLFCKELVEWIINNSSVDVRLFATCSSTLFTNISGIDPSNVKLYYRIFSTPVPFYKELPVILPYKNIFKDLSLYDPDIIHFETPGPVSIVSKSYRNRNDVNITSFYHTHFPDLLELYFSQLNFFLGKVVYSITSYYQKVVFNNLDVLFKYRMYDLPSYLSHQNSVSLPFGANKYFFSNENSKIKSPKQLSIERLITKVQSTYDIILFFAGRYYPEKNIQLLLQLTDKRDDVFIIFAGEGPLEKEINNARNVTSIGFIDKYTMKLVFQLVDAFILPSYSDTFGRVALEAIACKTPLLLSYNVNFTRILKENEEYLGFSPFKYDMLNSRINEAINDKKILDNCAQTAYKKFQNSSYEYLFNSMINEWGKLKL